jgi:acetolactate synthase small subunit
VSTDDTTTLVLIADHSMEMLSRVVSVLRARRYRISSLTLEAGVTPDVAVVTIVLDRSGGSVSRAALYLQRVEEVHEVRLATNPDARSD